MVPPTVVGLTLSHQSWNVTQACQSDGVPQLSFLLLRWLYRVACWQKANPCSSFPVGWVGHRLSHEWKDHTEKLKVFFLTQVGAACVRNNVRDLEQVPRFLVFFSEFFFSKFSILFTKRKSNDWWSKSQVVLTFLWFIRNGIGKSYFDLTTFLDLLKKEFWTW